jgi:(p)ppGpp synthase/HD superfamily hydrolase
MLGHKIHLDQFLKIKIFHVSSLTHGIKLELNNKGSREVVQTHGSQPTCFWMANVSTEKLNTKLKIFLKQMKMETQHNEICGTHQKQN